MVPRASAICDVPNVTVIARRAEDLAERERFDVVTARALAPLEVVAEYAAPLLRVGGTLVAWRGRREPESEAAAARAAGELGRPGHIVQGVSIKPGKPTSLALVDGTPSVGLPGHPVSGMVILDVFVRDVLRGLRRLPPPRAELAYGGWIFNSRPELRAQTPGVYLGPDARAAIATIEWLLGGASDARSVPAPDMDRV